MRTEAPTVAPPVKPVTYGGRAVSGFLWLAAQVVAGKALTLVSQLLLARFVLSPQDFGRVALASMVGVIAFVLVNSGQREALIRRHDRLHLWVTPATWISLTFGLLSFAVAAAAAPLAAWAYDDPALIGLVLVYATFAPLHALTFVPIALLEGRLRFRAVAVGGLLYSLTFAVTSLTFAFASRGTPYTAYALIVPVPLAALVKLVFLWRVARPPVRWRPQFRRWRFLLGDGLRQIAALAFTTITLQGDYLILGLFASRDVVGVYYFAYNLSIQTLVLLTEGARGILMPTLSKLSENPARQRQALLTSARSLAVVATPLLLLQAALAEPLLLAVFGAKWAASVPVLQLISVGMAFRSVTAPGVALLMTQGRFNVLLALSAAGAAVFLVLVTAAAAVAPEGTEAVAVAAAVAVYFIAAGLAYAYAGFRSAGGGWRDVRDVYATPLLLAVPAVGAAALAASMLPADLPARDLLRLAIVPVLAAALYQAALRRLAPQWWALLVGIYDRVRPGKKAPPARVGKTDVVAG